MLVVVAVIVFLPRGEENTVKTESTLGQSTVIANETKETEDASPIVAEDKSTDNSNEFSGESIGITVEKADEAKILELQTLLDEEETEGRALNFALGMLNNSDAQRFAAMDALSWIGGREAKAALVKQLKTGSNQVAVRASEVLRDLFAKELNEEHDEFDGDIILAAINATADESEREAYFVLLTAHVPEDCVPVLMELLDSSNKNIQELAIEYMTSVASGEDITTREQAAQWLDKYKAEKLKENAELKVAEDPVDQEAIPDDEKDDEE